MVTLTLKVTHIRGLSGTYIMRYFHKDLVNFGVKLVVQATKGFK